MIPLSIERLISAIEQSRQVIFAKMDGVGPSDPLESLSAKVERISKHGISKQPKNQILTNFRK